MGNRTKNASAKCTPQEYYDSVFDFGIVDRVRVPSDLPPGDYVLSFRWDCEQTKQIWSSCSDVTIKPRGRNVSGTRAFASQRGCTPCCSTTTNSGISSHGLCANCSKCLQNKTGDCNYCWVPLKWWDGLEHRTPRSP